MMRGSHSRKFLVLKRIVKFKQNFKLMWFYPVSCYFNHLLLP